MAPDPTGEDYSALSDPLAVFRMLILKGWRGREFVLYPRKKNKKSAPIYVYNFLYVNFWFLSYATFWRKKNDDE